MLLITNNYLAGKYKDVNVTIQKYISYNILFIAIYLTVLTYTKQRDSGF